jgi:hypothetical protein
MYSNNFFNAFHPTAPLLATCSSDNTAKLWRLSADESTATCVATLAEHQDWVLSVAFHSTALLLATWSCGQYRKNMAPFSRWFNCDLCGNSDRTRRLGEVYRVSHNFTTFRNLFLRQYRKIVAVIVRQLFSDLCGYSGYATLRCYLCCVPLNCSPFGYWLGQYSRIVAPFARLLEGNLYSNSE